MWGGTFIATRMASQVFGTFTGASLRYFVALLFMVPLALFQDKHFFKINRKQLFQMILLGATGIFAYSYFFFNGLKQVPASHGALIVALNPVLVMLISSFFDKEKVSAIQMLGVFLVGYFGYVQINENIKESEYLQKMKMYDFEIANYEIEISKLGVYTSTYKHNDMENFDTYSEEIQNKMRFENEIYFINCCIEILEAMCVPIDIDKEARLKME